MLLGSQLELPKPQRKRPELPVERLPLHKAVASGDLGQMNSLLSENESLLSELSENEDYLPHLVDSRDYFGRTPLFFAKNKKTIECLLEHNANPYLQDNNQADVITFQRTMHHDHVVKLLKDRIGFSTQKLDNFYEIIKDLLKKELAVAKKQGKKLLIMVGESHNQYPIYQIEKVFLKVASELGINSLLFELDQEGIEFLLDRHPAKAYGYPYSEGAYRHKKEAYRHSEKLIKNAYDKFDMSVEGIDRLHKMGLTRPDAALIPRNIAMKEEILQKNQNAILIVGAAHLKGLLKDRASRISERNFEDNLIQRMMDKVIHLIGKDSQAKYHIVPLNLADLCGNLCDKNFVTQDKELEQGMDFFRSPDKVIQVKSASHSAEITLSEPSKIIEYWNPSSGSSSNNGSPSEDPTVLPAPILPGFKQAKKRKVTKHDASVEPMSASMRSQKPQLGVQTRSKTKNLKHKSVAETGTNNHKKRKT